MKQNCNESKSKILEIDIKEDIIKNNIEEKCQSTSDFAPKKDDKPVKHKYGSYKNVLLTEVEYNKLLKEPNGAEAIEFLSNYREYKGYKAKSDYLAIRKWVFDALKEEEQKKNRIEGSRKNRFNESDRPFKEQITSTLDDADLGNVEM